MHQDSHKLFIDAHSLYFCHIKEENEVIFVILFGIIS